MAVLFARGRSIRVCKKRESQYDDHRECTLQKKANCNMMITLQKKANCIMMIIKKVLACMTCSITSSLPFTDGLSHAALVINNPPFCHKTGKTHHIIIIIIIIIIVIIITRPKPPYGRQGLAGSWGKDTVRWVHFGAFSTSHFAPSALSSDWIVLI